MLPSYFSFRSFTEHEIMIPPEKSYKEIQWNAVYPVTNGPQKFGRINGVAEFKGFFK